MKLPRGGMILPQAVSSGAALLRLGFHPASVPTGRKYAVLCTGSRVTDHRCFGWTKQLIRRSRHCQHHSRRSLWPGYMDVRKWAIGSPYLRFRWPEQRRLDLHRNAHACLPHAILWLCSKSERIAGHIFGGRRNESRRKLRLRRVQ
jgi:hypothetical protein